MSELKLTKVYKNLLIKFDTENVQMLAFVSKHALPLLKGSNSFAIQEMKIKKNR
jgi:hypothetical protein